MNTSAPPDKPAIDIDPLRYQASSRVTLMLLLGLLLSIVLSGQAGKLSPFALNEATGILLNLLLELVPPFVALLIVFAAWTSDNTAPGYSTNLLIGGFTFIAACDIIHALLQPGLLALDLGANQSLPLAAWLLARGIELLVVLILVLRIPTPGPSWLWQAGAFLALGLALGWGWSALNGALGILLPLNLQAYVHMLSGFAGLVSGLLLFAHAARFYQRWTSWIGLACLTHGVGSSLLGLSSQNAAPTLFLLGQMLQALAYIIICYLVFLAIIDAPRQRLRASEEKLATTSASLGSILESIPASVIFLRPDLSVGYRNANAEHDTLCSERLRPGQPLQAALRPEVRARISSAAQQVASQRSGAQYLYLNGENAQGSWHRKVVISPVNGHGRRARLSGFILMAFDITELALKRSQLDSVASEMRELRVSLDAHAIVANTDSRGVITSVNEKFCQISQYRQAELVGNSFRLLSAGVHDNTFFSALWHTISRGHVWQGELCNRRKNGERYWVYTTIVPQLGEDGSPRSYVAIQGDITERKQAEAEAQRLALHDDLTGLPNRRLLTDRLLQAVACARDKRRWGALMLLDIDHFKTINDTLGHSQGDALLRQLSAVLLRCVSASDTVARLGGDEFTVLLGTEWDSIEVAERIATQVANRICQAIAGSFLISNQNVVVTSSIGLTFYGSDNYDPEELLKQADLALYDAKAQGRNRSQVFAPALQEAANSYTRLVNDLRAGLNDNQLFLVYQPITDPHGRVCGAEALLRWRHPELGVLAPAEFVPLAERGGLIEQLGFHALNRACAQASLWAKDPKRADWVMAVNVSAEQMSSDHFVHDVLTTLFRFRLRPGALRLELTESLLHADLENTIEKMRHLQNAGVGFSLDDFGTGFSSLSYLKQLPINQLKIDRSFVRDVMHDERDASVARAILSLARSLNLDVIAEGVETADQLHFLVAEGCTRFQGFLICEPVSPDALSERYMV